MKDVLFFLWVGQIIFMSTVKKHWVIPFYFVQFYEIHTNDIIMVTGSNAHMQIKYKDMYKYELYTLKVRSD